MPVTRDDLPEMVVEALRSLNGRGSIVDICKFIWNHYESDLRASGDLFYRWQYEMRWAGLKLRKDGILKPTENSGRLWELA